MFDMLKRKELPSSERRLHLGKLRGKAPEPPKSIESIVKDEKHYDIRIHGTLYPRQLFGMPYLNTPIPFEFYDLWE